VKIDSIRHKYGGTQKMEIQDVGSSLVVPLELAGFMIDFKHRLPTTEEDKFHQQVIDNEQKNSLNTKSDYSSDIKVDLVEQDIPKLS
jgi:hypothetical protein